MLPTSFWTGFHSCLMVPPSPLSPYGRTASEETSDKDIIQQCASLEPHACGLRLMYAWVDINGTQHIDSQGRATLARCLGIDPGWFDLDNEDFLPFAEFLSLIHRMPAAFSAGIVAMADLLGKCARQIRVYDKPEACLRLFNFFCGGMSTVHAPSFTLFAEHVGLRLANPLPEGKYWEPDQFKAALHLIPPETTKTARGGLALARKGTMSAVEVWDILEHNEEKQGLQEALLGNAIYAKTPRGHRPCQRHSPTPASSSKIIHPGPEYTGPRLSFPLTQGMLMGLVNHYGIGPNVPLHQNYIQAILGEAKTLFAKLPRVTRIQTLSGGHQRLVVVGDLHGQLQDLLVIFLAHGFPSPEGTQYIFNGDFVDRGPHGTEIVVILLAYKLLYPDSVHLNRGNHENTDMGVYYGFFDEVLCAAQGFAC